MRNNRKGFTLVEIMIVVAIIALLAVIAIPNLLRARVSANNALAQSTLRTLGTASHNWAADNRDGTFPASFAAMFGATPRYIQVNYDVTPDVSGFSYAYVVGADNLDFTITATATSCGRTGTVDCTVDQTGDVICAPCV